MDSLICAIRQNSLRKVIFFTWLISIGVSLILVFLGFGGGGAIAEMYSVEFGFSIYYIVCCFHGIAKQEKSKKMSYLGGGGLTLFFLSMVLTSTDDDLFRYMLNYEGEDSYPLFSFAVSLWLILKNKMGMLTLFLGTALHIYASWRASKNCEKRYAYLFYITEVAYSALMLMFLLLITGDDSIWYSNSVYFLFSIWMFSPAVIFVSAIIREGKSSIPSEGYTTDEEQDFHSNEILDRTKTINITESNNTIRENGLNTIQSYSTSTVKAVQSPSNPAIYNKDKKTMAIILGVIVLGIVLFFAMMSSINSKDKKDINDSKLDVKSQEEVAEESQYYSNYEEDEVVDYGFEDVGQSYGIYEADIKKIVELTYGDNWYLSSDFKRLQNACKEKEEEGYLCGPDFDCWWWNQDPNQNLNVEDVEILSNDQVVVYVIADGTRLKVDMFREGDYWKYDDFTDSNYNSYKDMMRDDL